MLNRFQNLKQTVVMEVQLYTRIGLTGQWLRFLAMQNLVASVREKENGDIAAPCKMDPTSSNSARGYFHLGQKIGGLSAAERFAMEALPRTVKNSSKSMV